MKRCHPSTPAGNLPGNRLQQPGVNAIDGILNPVHLWQPTTSHTCISSSSIVPPHNKGVASAPSRQILCNVERRTAVMYYSQRRPHLMKQVAWLSWQLHIFRNEERDQLPRSTVLDIGAIFLDFLLLIKRDSCAEEAPKEGRREKKDQLNFPCFNPGILFQATILTLPCASHPLQSIQWESCPAGSTNCVYTWFCHWARRTKLGWGGGNCNHHPDEMEWVTTFPQNGINIHSSPLTPSLPPPFFQFSIV